MVGRALVGKCQLVLLGQGRCLTGACFPGQPYLSEPALELKFHRLRVILPGGNQHHPGSCPAPVQGLRPGAPYHLKRYYIGRV
ncbi:MAG: hypothetical protein D6730_05625 [Bacteroidetes bacterium]|nr:MAG: hypothetical protein D6730_05625 [Bacteroidota bacterium]